MSKKCRHLILVLGDQLNRRSAAFDDFDPQLDVVWMAETDEEATHVWCHKFRLVAFFAPMRHFRNELLAAGIAVDYHELSPNRRAARNCTFRSVLTKTLERLRPQRLVLLEPGDYRVKQQLEDTVRTANVAIEQREDRSFFCTRQRFRDWRLKRKQMVLEQFYREMRRENDILLDGDGNPEGGSWNYDSENRVAFGKQGPPVSPDSIGFPADEVTKQVIEMVESRFPGNPGSTVSFDLPVNRTQALKFLDEFIDKRLPLFGKYQDAMWHGERELYHSRLSHALNISLLNPREVVERAIESYREGHVPLSACEGFVRQILGWREFVRGIYWTQMPDYETSNFLSCDPNQDVPDFFWDGKTEMACIADSMRLLLETAYAHHIQRLMVFGLFAQLLGVFPLNFHRWHMAMYADAIDWVSAPNTIGMSQFGDGGLMATKPYCASGNYINRMSNHCSRCRFRYKEAIGDDACPFTTLYWDFLSRHRERLQSNLRMKMQYKNLDRKSPEELDLIKKHAQEIRDACKVTSMSAGS